MTNELVRWAQTPTGILANRDQRQNQRAVANLVTETKFAGLKVDAQAALAARTMERAVDVDAQRRALAGNDETLNAILTRIEMNFIDAASRIQRTFGSAFPL